MTSTAKEPLTCWLDNMYGPTGVAVGTGKTLEQDHNTFFRDLIRTCAVHKPLRHSAAKCETNAALDQSQRRTCVAQAKSFRVGKASKYVLPVSCLDQHLILVLS